MKTDKVFELLKLLNESDELVSRSGKRILKYIYQDIYLDIFEKGKEIASIGHNYGSTNYENAVKPYDVLKKNVSPFLDGTDSILSYFTEMVNDNKPEFINLFSKKIDVYFEMVDNHFYSSEDFTPLSFTFNIYCMLRAYHSHKDNYELFAKIVDDCDRLIDCSVYNSKKNKNSYGNFSVYGCDSLAAKKNFMDKLIDCVWYDKTDIASENLRLLFNNFTSSSSYVESKITPAIETLKEIDVIYSDYLELKESGVDIDIDVFKDITAKYIGSKNNYHKKFVWYDKKLLIGNRFEFFNSVLFNAIKSPEMTDDLARRILRLDFSLFNDLNKDSQDKVDSFEKIIAIILDSDTFYEVSSKFKDVEEACSLYVDGLKEEALELIQELRSEKHKKVLEDGRVVGTVNNSINQVSSGTERSIGERMRECYHELYDNYNVMYLVSSALNRDPSSIEEFTSYFDQSLSAALEKERQKLEAARLQKEKEEAERIAREQALLEEREKVVVEEMPVESPIQEIGVVDYRANLSTDTPKEETGFLKLKSIFGKRG